MFVGQYLSGRASVAGPFTGSEASELLGIVGGLAHGLQHAQNISQIVFCLDSQNSLDHVFRRIAPVHEDGRQLWPGISLARMLADRLERLGVTVGYEKVPRNDNLAHCIAKREQRRRYDRGWVSSDNWWPECMDSKWLGVFGMIATNRRWGRADYDLPDAVVRGILEQ